MVQTHRAFIDINTHMRTFVVNVIVTAWQGDLTTAFSERREKSISQIYVREVWNKSVCCIPRLQ